MLTSNKLKIIAVKKIIKLCIFIFLTITLCLIVNNSIKYENMLKKTEKEEIAYLKRFSKNEEESKLRVNRWLANITGDFEKINKIKSHLIYWGTLIKKDDFKEDEAKDIIATPGEEYRKKNNTSKNKGIWPATDTRNIPLQVNYDFGTFVPANDVLDEIHDYNKNLIKEDKLRFASFINDITSKVTEHINNKKISEKYNLQKRTEYSTLMFDVFDVLEDVDEFFPELEILWIYVGSSEGAFANFPANGQSYRNQNDAQPYNPTSRPWFKEAIHSKSNMGLSKVYDDYSEHLNSVRTLWHKVKVNVNNNERIYVIGVDFYLSNNAISVGVSNLIDKKSIPSILSGVINNSIIYGIIVSALIFIICISSLLFGLSGFNELLVFGLSSYKSLSVNNEILAEFMYLLKYDDSNNNSIRFEKTNKSANETTFLKNISAKIKTNKYMDIAASLERERLYTEQESKMMQAISNQEINSLYSGIRGKEFWKVTESKEVLGKCPICGQPIKVTQKDQNWEQIMVINHVAQDSPEVLILPDNGDPPESIKNALTEHIIKSNQPVQQTSNYQKILHETTKFKIPIQLKDYSPLVKMKLDYHVLQTGRYNSDNMIKLSTHLYKNSNVKAVCHIGYFKLLLEMEREGEGFLYVGESIERILVAFTTEEFERTKSWFESESNIIRKGAQIYLYLVNILDLPEGLRKYRRWDFAIVDSYINASSNIDLSKNTGSTVVITTDYHNESNRDDISGTVSWRLADVAFYETLYRAITRNRREENNLYIPK